MDVLSPEIAKTMGVFGLSMVSFWAAIPAALALGLNPFTIIFITSTSYASSVLLCILPARFIKKWTNKYLSRHIEKSTHGNSLMMRFWQQYGAIGFGLLAPMITGAYLGAIIGMTLNIPHRRLILWMMIGVVVWSAVLTMGGFTCVKLIPH